MPFPVAPGLVAASVAAALLPSSPTRKWRPLWIAAFLGVCPDFDYALNWLQVPPGGWHHGFTHSFLFAFVLGLTAAILTGAKSVRSVVMFSAAAVSHTLLDFVMTESRGVALWWPFTDRRYKLQMHNPINYDWSSASLWEGAVDTLRISCAELIIFAPILIAVMFLRTQLEKPQATG